MNSTEINLIFHDLESYWKNHGTPILNKLQHGIIIEGNKIDNFYGELPTDLFKLFKWKNGTKPENNVDPIGSLCLFPLGMLLSFDEIIYTQKEMAGRELGWERTKLPLFEDGGGEYFLIDCDSSKSSFGKIIYFSRGAVDFNRMISIYDSLYTLFQTIYECNKSGVFNYNTEKGILDYDNLKKNKISRELNPLSDYWKLFD
jgi:SMI1 / KNR4 family (SUKH-1)